MKHVREFRLLAEGLPNVPRHKFTMSQWSAGRLDPNASGFDCGYAGCAIGWLPKFAPDNTLMRFGAEEPKYRFKSQYGTFQTLYGLPAVERYFDIDAQDAESIFMPITYPGGNPTPTDVSLKMLAFLDKQGIPRESE